VRDAAVDVGHLQRDVDDPVAVAAVVVVQGAVRVDAAAQHEPGGPGAQHVGVVVAVAGLRAGVRDQLHAPDQLVVQRGLGGVADHPDHRVPAGHRERVAVGVVLDQPDELAQLVEVEFGQALLAGEGLLHGHGLPPRRNTRTIRWVQDNSVRRAAQQTPAGLVEVSGLPSAPRSELGNMIRNAEGL
jgi:hypothetical protein